MDLDAETLERLRTFQRNEITEYHIYRRLARTLNDPENRRVLESIADDERQHYEQWKAYTGEEVDADRAMLLILGRYLMVLQARDRAAAVAATSATFSAAVS